MKPQKGWNPEILVAWSSAEFCKKPVGVNMSWFVWFEYPDAVGWNILVCPLNEREVGGLDYKEESGSPFSLWLWQTENCLESKKAT